MVYECVMVKQLREDRYVMLRGAIMLARWCTRSPGKVQRITVAGYKRTVEWCSRRENFAHARR